MTGAPAGLSEKLRIDLNGASQGMFIQGRDPANPVLLHLHGGLPEYFLTRRYPGALALGDFFTVCWWEQRGAGLSYHPGDPPPTTDQLIRDTLAVTRYLRDRFRQDRIYLLAHSGGTFIGIQAAARAPELYHAYIGVAQISRQLESERLAWEYMRAEYARLGQRRRVARLDAAPVTPDGVPEAYLRVRDTAMHRLGVGTARDMRSVMTGIFLESLRAPCYTPAEKLNLWRGKARSGVSAVWRDILATDLAEVVPEVGVPVHSLHGVYDYTVSYPLAEDYLRRLKAPAKAFHPFQRSAHSPHFEEPEKALDILRKSCQPAGRSLRTATSRGGTP